MTDGRRAKVWQPRVKISFHVEHRAAAGKKIENPPRPDRSLSLPSAAVKGKRPGEGQLPVPPAVMEPGGAADPAAGQAGGRDGGGRDQARPADLADLDVDFTLGEIAEYITDDDGDEDEFEDDGDGAGGEDDFGDDFGDFGGVPQASEIRRLARQLYRLRDDLQRLAGRCQRIAEWLSRGIHMTRSG